MSGIISVNPTTINAGDILVGAPFSFDILLSNIGDESFDVTDIASGDVQVTQSLIPPFTLGPTGQQGGQITIIPAGTGAGNTSVVYIATAVNSSVAVVITWNGVVAGTKALSVTPAGFAFPNTKTMVSSSEQLFTVQNTSNVDVIVSGYTWPADFGIGPTTGPVLPHTIPAGGSYQFGIVFTPLSIGFTTENVQVASDAAASPFVILCSGIGYAVTPAYVITGGHQTLLFALAFPESVPGVNPSVMIPPNPITWACEEDGNIDNTFMLPFPTEQGAVPGFSYEKQIPRVLFHYEDYGVCVVRVSLTSERGQIVFKDVTLGTAGADQTTKLAFADVNITDEIHTISFEANGPFFLVDYIIKYVPKGEKKA